MARPFRADSPGAIDPPKVSPARAGTLLRRLFALARPEAVPLAIGEILDLPVDTVDLVHERGTPRPAPGDCDFPANAVHRIVTSQVRAGSATLDFRRQSALTGQAQVPVAQTGADVNAATGWTRSSSRSLGGRDIVLAGMLERWRVEVDRHEHNLGPTPEFGRALTVGRSLLRVSVLGYDFGAEFIHRDDLVMW